MIYYVYKNKRNGKLVCGTDYTGNNGPKQMLDEPIRAPLLIPAWKVEETDWFDSDPEFFDRGRRISRKTYKMVKVRVEEVEE